MNKEEHKKEALNNLKEIIKTTQNNIDAMLDDDFCVSLLSYKGTENSMNYIRLLTQKVQLNMMKYRDFKNE
jgi:hypothetical protein